MASQQTLWAETIRGMKLALKRRPDDSDSDSPDSPPARRVRTNTNTRLNTSRPLSYCRKQTHAGYTRYTLSKNPAIFDDDGDLVPSDASDSELENASPVDEDPFGDVRLEELLQPLTSAAELPEHPSLSVAYKSRALTQMADEALEMVRREKESLWRMKQVLLRLRGDAPWMPCAQFESVHDDLLLQGDGQMDGFSAVPSIISTAAADEAPCIEATAPKEIASAEMNGAPQELAGIGAHVGEMAGVETMDMAAGRSLPAEPKSDANTEVTEKTEDPAGDIAMDSLSAHEYTMHPQTATEGLPEATEEPAAPTDAGLQAHNPTLDEIRKSVEPASESTSQSGNAPSHSMLTRRRANQPSHSPSPSPSPSDSASIPPIHPWFQYPANCQPDTNFGLPAAEAEDMRKSLLLYVQKQEQVVREAVTLANGLLKADRMRRGVWQACRAEGHVGELSDGEDWYDLDEWGLDKDLLKGKEEVEEEEEGRRGGRGRRRVQRW